MLARNCQAAGREGGQGWPEEAGGTWTWTALDAETKLIVSWLSAGVMPNAPMPFMTDLASRLANRVQLTTDGRKA